VPRPSQAPLPSNSPLFFPAFHLTSFALADLPPLYSEQPQPAYPQQQVFSYGYTPPQAGKK
jgi:hypothetical protein